MITNKEIGEALQALSNDLSDIIKISRWAEHIYSTRCRELSMELDNVIMALSAMEHGPEFEYTESELKTLSHLLIDG